MTAQRKAGRPRQTPYWTRQIQMTLWKFRKEHDWQPGMTWDPYQGKYVWPQGRER